MVLSEVTMEFQLKIINIAIQHICRWHLLKSFSHTRNLLERVDADDIYGSLNIKTTNNVFLTPSKQKAIGVGIGREAFHY